MLQISEARFIELVDQAIGNNKLILQIVKTLDQHTETLDGHTQTIDGLTNAIENLDERTHKQGILAEKTNSDVRLVIERVTPLMEKSASFEEVDHALKNNNDQIKITQKTLNKHIEDKSIHRDLGDPNLDT